MVGLFGQGIFSSFKLLLAVRSLYGEAQSSTTAVVFSFQEKQQRDVLLQAVVENLRQEVWKHAAVPSPAPVPAPVIEPESTSQIESEPPTVASPDDGIYMELAFGTGAGADDSEAPKFPGKSACTYDFALEARIVGT